MTPEEYGRKISKIIAKAWIDDGFKQRLQSDPAKTLKAEGVEVSPGIEFRTVVDTARVRHLLLPLKPTGELSVEQLEEAAGGCCVCRCYTTGGCDSFGLDLT